MGVSEIACQRHTSHIIAWLCSFNLEKAWQELVDSILNDQFKKNIDRDRTYIYTVLPLYKTPYIKPTSL